jgi:hypothetical protein
MKKTGRKVNGGPPPSRLTGDYVGEMSQLVGTCIYLALAAASRERNLHSGPCHRTVWNAITRNSLIR